MKKIENHARIIFHIDMNQFFCSVACILDPTLRGKAFAIGRENTKRGVLSTASYEARKYGIHSAMSQVEAIEKLPSLLIIHLDYSHYIEYHNKFINIIREYTNLIEVASIDEVYADMTEISKVKHPLVLAKEIQKRLLVELELPSSIGIGPTLFLAKMASDMKKPLGLTVIRKRDIVNILYPVDVSDIYGIGKKTHPRLKANGINTIGDFMNPNNKDKVISLVGENTYNYAYNALTGNSSNKVDPQRYDSASSISESQTYDVYKESIDDILYEMRKMTRSVYQKMIKYKYMTKTITITLRDSDFKTITRQKSLNEYTDDLVYINQIVSDLLEENFEEKRYRLVGVGLSNLIDRKSLPKEYNLFTMDDVDEKEEEIHSLIKEFQSKFGEKALYRKNDKK